MDAQAGLTLFNGIASAAKSIYGIVQSASKLETKQELMGVYDTLMSLKVQAAELEDENHNLKARLRFKTDVFEFDNPFYYEKKYPDRPLCPVCFSNEKASPMSDAYTSANAKLHRRCLVCQHIIRVNTIGVQRNR